ncbi:MAG: hypothetical protein GX434_00440 [Peptococcaceae bacterium]|nr:hypothetical protein [Peptococcaceae bacterium]
MTKIIMTEARSEHYNEIFHLIKSYLDPEGGWERNKHIFSYTWPSMPDFQETTPGYVLLDGEKVVGYQGFINSRRNIGGKPVKYVTASTWVVHPDYRNYSLQLLKPFSNQEDFRVSFSAKDDIQQILTSRWINCKLFDETAFIFPICFSAFRYQGVKVCFDPDIVWTEAGRQERELIEDNCRYIARPARVYTPEEAFTLIYRPFTLRFDKLFRIKVSFCEILYCGNRRLFSRYIRPIIRQLGVKNRVWFVVCASRYLTLPKIPWAIKKQLKCYCSDFALTGINPEDIDDLYSEKTVINFENPPKPIK